MSNSVDKFIDRSIDQPVTQNDKIGSFRNNKKRMADYFRGLRKSENLSPLINPYLPEPFITVGSREWGSEFEHRGLLPAMQNSYNRKREEVYSFLEKHRGKVDKPIKDQYKSMIDEATILYEKALVFEQLQAYLLSLTTLEGWQITGQALLENINNALQFVYNAKDLKPARFIFTARFILAMIIGSIPILSQVACKKVNSNETPPTNIPTEVSPTATPAIEIGLAPLSETPVATEDSGEGTTPNTEVEIIVQPEVSPIATNAEVQAINAAYNTAFTANELTWVSGVDPKKGVFVAHDVDNGNIIAAATFDNVTRVSTIPADSYALSEDKTTIIFSQDGIETGRLNLIETAESGDPTITPVAAPEAPIGIFGADALTEFAEYIVAIKQVENNMYIYVQNTDGTYGKRKVEFAETRFEETPEGFIATSQDGVEMTFNPELNNWMIKQFETSSGFVTYYATTEAMNNKSTAAAELLLDGLGQTYADTASDAISINLVTSDTQAQYRPEYYSINYNPDKTYDQQLKELLNNAYPNSGFSFETTLDIHSSEYLSSPDFNSAVENAFENRFFITFAMLYYKTSAPTQEQIETVKNAMQSNTTMSVALVGEETLWDITKGVEVALDEYRHAPTEKPYYVEQSGRLVIVDRMWRLDNSFASIANLVSLENLLVRNNINVPADAPFAQQFSQTYVIIDHGDGLQFLEPIANATPITNQ